MRQTVFIVNWNRLLFRDRCMSSGRCCCRLVRFRETVQISVSILFYWLLGWKCSLWSSWWSSQCLVGWWNMIHRWDGFIRISVCYIRQLGSLLCIDTVLLQWVFFWSWTDDTLFIEIFVAIMFYYYCYHHPSIMWIWCPIFSSPIYQK